MAAAPFVDYYAVLGASPETPFNELKKAYHEKLREFHPDKRPHSSGGVGQRVTQALVEAWEVLSDPAKKEAYDATYNKGREETLQPSERAELRRREGNELYKEAQNLSKNASAESLTAAATTLRLFQAAIVKYSEGVSLAPQDHRILSNRALCYAALKDWTRCRQDASIVTQLKPDFMKGWFLLAKGLWKDGLPLEAMRELDVGLSLLPGNAELLALRAEVAPDFEACRSEGLERLPRLPSGRHSRNVSPVVTQCNSRVATPPGHGASRSSRSPAPAAAGDGSNRPREHSRPRARDNYGAPSNVDFKEQTPYFGMPPVPPATERTARFGNSVTQDRGDLPGLRLPGQARSVSPADRTCAAAAAEATYGTFGCPQTARPVYGAEGGPPAPPPPKGPAAGGEAPGPRQRIVSLQGMAAASRHCAERGRAP